MKPTRARIVVAISLLSLCGGVGCQRERSFLSIDSDSRIPWMGIQLVPRGSKKDEQKPRSIARTEPPPVPELLDRPREKTTLRWNPFKSSSRPKRIPLPRTDLDELEPASVATTSDDF